MRALANPAKAVELQRFFKTGPGEYAEGDRFLGIMVPQIRRVVREFQDLSLGDVTRLLRSGFHEERLLALLILVRRFEKGDDRARQEIYRTYLNYTRFINNWDLVDVTAAHLVGGYLRDRDRAPLYRLALSDDLWERRIAIVATFHFIRGNDFRDTLRVARLLLRDREDLIHKAVGWMLREVGKRDRAVEEMFLKRHGCAMPRTMLRYAIERFPERLRRRYLLSTRDRTLASD